VTNPFTVDENFIPSSTPLESEVVTTDGVTTAEKTEYSVVVEGAVTGFITTAAVATLVVSAALVARTVTVCFAVTEVGAL